MPDQAFPQDQAAFTRRAGAFRRSGRIEMGMPRDFDEYDTPERRKMRGPGEGTLDIVTNPREGSPGNSPYGQPTPNANGTMPGE